MKNGGKNKTFIILFSVYIYIYIYIHIVFLNVFICKGPKCLIINAT